MDSLGQGASGWGGTSGERPPNMLASIQSYLHRTQELMQNPTVLLPSLPDPPASGRTILLPVLVTSLASGYCPENLQRPVFSAFLP